MKCPYIVNTKIVSQETTDRDEIGNILQVQTIEKQTGSHTECLGCECAAWDDGRCKYKC